MENKLAPDTRYKRPPQPVKRWQVRDLGALWPYDATPPGFLPGSTAKQGLLDLLDDATRLNTGARLYERETLLAHLDFLPRAFTAHGLPLALYVDYHSFFFTHTPQAKGKIERRHDYWQKRLPPLLAADHLVELAGANALLDPLLPHANQHEVHRELGTTPHAARQQALSEKRSVLRPVPACPWWPYGWSQRTAVRGGDDGKVPVGLQRQTSDAPPRSKVRRCLRPAGDVFYLRHAPDPKVKPVVLLHCPVF